MRGTNVYGAELPSTPFMLYVSSSGSDANPGTPQAPLRSILRASQLARPGTTVMVAPGIYAGGFKTTASGSAGARIYYVSASRWGTHIVPPPILAGTGPAEAAASAAWDKRGSYVDVIGFDNDGRARSPVRPGAMVGTTAASLPGSAQCSGAARGESPSRRPFSLDRTEQPHAAAGPRLARRLSGTPRLLGELPVALAPPPRSHFIYMVRKLPA